MWDDFTEAIQMDGPSVTQDKLWPAHNKTRKWWNPCKFDTKVFNLNLID